MSEKFVSVASPTLEGLGGVTEDESINAAKTVKVDDHANGDDNLDLDAGTGKHGLMAKADKVKLDGIASGSDVTGDNPPQAHTIDSHSDTMATGAELEELTGGSETALHGHAAAGLSYTELAGTDQVTASGQGLGDGAWGDWDLSAIIGAGSTVVEIRIEKLIATDDVGVRKNGSALARSFSALKAQSIVISVECDANRVIEIMSNDVSDSDTFSVMGYWS